LAFLLCETADSEKQLDKAIDWAVKAQTAVPREPTVQDTLGWIYYKKGDMKMAAKLVGAAREKIPNNPSVNYHMGMISCKIGNHSQGREYLVKALGVKENFIGRDEAARSLKQL
jgi:Flp pilus assembly protein TadD